MKNITYEEIDPKCIAANVKFNETEAILMAATQVADVLEAEYLSLVVSAATMLATVIEEDPENAAHHRNVFESTLASMLKANEKVSS